jgi:hypothetical protein
MRSLTGWIGWRNDVREIFVASSVVVGLAVEPASLESGDLKIYFADWG